MEQEVLKQTKCATCGREMPEERLEFGYFNCTKCNMQERPKGVMEYGHKTAGVLIITDDIGFRELKKPASSRR